MLLLLSISFAAFCPWPFHSQYIVHVVMLRFSAEWMRTTHRRMRHGSRNLFRHCLQLHVLLQRWLYRRRTHMHRYTTYIPERLHKLQILKKKTD